MTDWDQSDSHNKLRPWLLVDPLTLYQAVMLIFGRAPTGWMTGRPSGYEPMALAMKQAIERRDLPARIATDPLEGRPYSLDNEDVVHVQQADVREWLRKIGSTDAFFFLADPDEWPPQDGSPKIAKPMGTRERENLLELIAVLAELAGIDLRPDTKGHAEAKRIEAAMAARKVTLQPRTVADKLAAARELIRPQGPERLPDN